MSPKRKTKDKDLPAGVYRHGRKYRMRIPGIGGKLTWKILGDNKREALLKWADIVGDDSATTLSGICDRYKAEILPGKARSTREKQAKQLELLRHAFGHIPVDAVEPRHIAQYHDIRGKKAPVAANREIALMSHVMKCAVRWGYRNDNPCREIQRHTEKPRDREVTEKELWDVMKLARPIVRYAIWLGYLTGLRREDVLKITLFDLKPDGIHVREGKTGKRAIILWAPELHRVINRIKALPRGPGLSHLFATQYGRLSGSGFDSAWQRLMVEYEKQGGTRWQFKDLRAKHAADFEAAGGDATKQLGHSSRAVTRRHYLRKAREITPIKRN